MVHLRLNEKEANPNPHINFISALKADAEDEEDARRLLRALAAQVRPVMKAHGFGVNSFEEVRSSFQSSRLTRSYPAICALVRIQQGICGEELEQWGNGW